ncbi:hypothetical protein [Aquimonas sp.]|jgi:hypothetical protein|uniref:hypothetical protein n=1 Tax=Aquimonas sp. TaxID=1872588 RepID=UPI0037BFD185
MNTTVDPTGAIAAIAFALQTDQGLEFLRCWNVGAFDRIRDEWPEAPEDVFVGAVPGAGLRTIAIRATSEQELTEQVKRAMRSDPDSVVFHELPSTVSAPLRNLFESGLTLLSRPAGQIQSG